MSNITLILVITFSVLVFIALILTMVIFFARKHIDKSNNTHCTRVVGFGRDRFMV